MTNQTHRQLLMHLLDAETGAEQITPAPAYDHSDIAAMTMAGLIFNNHETGRWHVTGAGCAVIFPGEVDLDALIDAMDAPDYDAEAHALAGWSVYATGGR